MQHESISSPHLIPQHSRLTEVVKYEVSSEPAEAF